MVDSGLRARRVPAPTHTFLLRLLFLFCLKVLSLHLPFLSLPPLSTPPPRFVFFGNAFL